ncbi:hypothetical protein HGI30_19740 [Paenibacillus albicereus]|uniref:PLD phosphodiesterase domain-containing protein n=1 Tax=Paenibacillus albicereus TaxID=2726185 RepID=A0A6H2H299_9BACL|nr:AAA domain-containing protein [Paenibacillus albicereus]QJC53546.1 hypothetical protein HGI30_19740 [Paenibacillus albicereus]
MKASLRESIRYFIRYEDHARFMDASLNKVEGQQLPEKLLGRPDELTERIHEKESGKLLDELLSISDRKASSLPEQRKEWKEAIEEALKGEKKIEDVLLDLPLRHSAKRKEFADRLRKLKNQDSFILFYPLLLQRFKGSREDAVQPVFTFECRIADARLQVQSFQMNSKAMDIIVAEAEGCAPQEVRGLARETLAGLETRLHHIKAESIDTVLELVDQSFREQLPTWKHGGLLDFRAYDGWTLTRKALLTKSDYQEVADSPFRKELARLMERLERHESPLLQDYVTGHDAPTDFKAEPLPFTSHRGSYTSDYPVNEKQWRLLQTYRELSLMAVNGPPGTGKTTLIKEMIADTMVRKACLLLERWDEPWQLKRRAEGVESKKDYYETPFAGANPFSMVLTSTNNKAVDNIGEDLLREVRFMSGVLESAGEAEATAFCARLGRKENMDSFKQQKLLGLLKGLRLLSDDSTAQQEDARPAFQRSMAALKEIEQNVQAFWTLQQSCREQEEFASEEELRELTILRRTAWEEAEQSYADQNEQAEALRLQAGKLTMACTALKEKLRSVERDRSASESARKEAYRHLERLKAWRRFPQSLLSFLPKRKKFLEDHPSESYLQETRIAPLHAAVARLEEEATQAATELEIAARQAAELQTSLSDAEQQLHVLEADKILRDQQKLRLEQLIEHEGRVRTEIGSSASLIGASFYALVNAPKLLKLRKTLFDQALAVQEQYIVRHREAILFNLEKVGEEQKWFKSFYSPNGSRLDEDQSGIRAVWESFFLCFPVVTTTLHSFTENLFHLLPQLIDTLFVDEAGQILPHYLCAPLFRSRRAVIVGDPRQLEPVRPFALDLVASSGVPEELQERICVLTNSAQDYADRGGRFYEYMGDSKAGLILDEHRRCEAAIMQFSNQHVYHGWLKLIQPDEGGKLFGANAVAFDIRGLKDATRHQNAAEAEACRKAVELLAARHGEQVKGDIGIIAPFKHQVELLQALVPGVDIGTVHTFQGKEKRFILLSLVLDGLHRNHAGLAAFVGGKPNLLNVAFSRAKEQFILIGNLEAASTSGNYLSKALQTIQQYGAVYSMFNDELESERSEGHRQEAYRIYDSGEERGGSSFLMEAKELLQGNIVLQATTHRELLLLALDHARQSLGIVSPWISRRVVDEDFFERLDRMQVRRASVRIRYGYSGKMALNDDLHQILKQDYYQLTPESKGLLKETLQKLYEKLKQDMAHMAPLHAKILLIDDEIMFIGSHNWLANKGYKREEISYLIRDRRAIAYVKERFAL